MLGEVTHLQTILEDLTNLTTEPNKLPPASEQVWALVLHLVPLFLLPVPPLSSAASSMLFSSYKCCC